MVTNLPSEEVHLTPLLHVTLSVTLSVTISVTLAVTISVTPSVTFCVRSGSPEPGWIRSFSVKWAFLQPLHDISKTEKIWNMIKMNIFFDINESIICRLIFFTFWECYKSLLYRVGYRSSLKKYNIETYLKCLRVVNHGFSDLSGRGPSNNEQKIKQKVINLWIMY